MATLITAAKQRATYDIIVTGASGNLGRRIVPRLAASSSRILLVGRDASLLREQYSSLEGVDTSDYTSLEQIESCDTLIHLAARNNDRSGTLEDFRQVNVDFAEFVCRHFVRLGGRRFVNVSSIQSLDAGNLSPYAISKEMGRKSLFNIARDRLDNVYIGYFYDSFYFGERFNYLTILGPLGESIFSVIKTVKPTTSAQSLVEYIEYPPKVALHPNIVVDDLNQSAIYRSVMRAGDIAVAIIILFGLLPILICLWAWIRIDSQGPAIFAQTRVGRSQRAFTLYKFRSMRLGTESAGTHQVSAASVTRVGKFLRRTKLDELPQAFNLLRGDMTLVGPRPCLPVQEELVSQRSARGVFNIKPGVTGYAQVQGIDMSRPAELAQSDYEYMKLQCITFNLHILVSTVLGHGSGDRVAPSQKL